MKDGRKVQMWFLFALLSAVFAALTSILAKIGIEGVILSTDWICSK